MQTTQELLNDANRHFRSADHIAYVTYPLLQDNKLIVAVLENLNNTALRIMEAVLQQEETNQENFKGKYEIFKRSRLVARFGGTATPIGLNDIGLFCSKSASLLTC